MVHTHASQATSLGLAAVALQLPITAEEASAGLVPAATASHIMGSSGATLILVMLFMAVTASGSHEMIAVSSLITYDIYRPYFKPNATGEEVSPTPLCFVICVLTYIIAYRAFT